MTVTSGVMPAWTLMATSRSTLCFVHHDPAAAERVGDVLGRDRAVELAAPADLDAHRERGRADPVRRDLGFFPLALPLVLAARDVVLPGAVRAARGRDRHLGLDQVMVSGSRSRG
jgi:hypothetical protein